MSEELKDSMRMMYHKIESIIKNRNYKKELGIMDLKGTKLK